MSSSSNISPRDSDEALRYVRGLSPDLAPFVSSSSDVTIDSHAPPQVLEPSSNPSTANDCSNCSQERSKSRSLKRGLDDSLGAHDRLKRHCTALFRERHDLMEKLERARHRYQAAENRSRATEEELRAAEERIGIAEATTSTAQADLANLNERFHQREEDEYRYYNHVARRASTRANRLQNEAEAIEELKNAEIGLLRAQNTTQRSAWAAHVASLQAQLLEKEDEKIIEKAQCDLLLVQKDEQIALLNNRLLEEQSRSAWQSSSFNDAHARFEAREQARETFYRGLIDRIDDLPDFLALADSAAVIGVREWAIERVERLIGPIETVSEREAAILILFDRIKDLAAERDATHARLHELQMEAGGPDDELWDAED